MSDERNDSDELERKAGAPAQQPDAVDGELAHVLVRTLERVLGIPEKDAELLVERVLIQALQSQYAPETSVGFLTMRSLEAGQKWLHSQGMQEPEEEQTAAAAADVRRHLLARKVLDTLTESARKAIRMKFRDKKSYEEIAAELDATVPYAQRLVVNTARKILELAREEE